MTTGMEYFLVLAEEQSISRVAQHLFVTQQSMSEQMKRLEQLYCAKLFTRRPRFQLTAAGEALLYTYLPCRVKSSSGEQAGMGPLLAEKRDSPLGTGATPPNFQP